MDKPCIKTGDNFKKDLNAIIGYKPGRKIKSLTLTIGDNSRVRSGTVIYLGTKIGDGLETGHNVVIREENCIGNNFSIWSNSIVDYGCKIGNNVRVHANVYIAQMTVIEEDVFIAPGVVFANDKYPLTHDFKSPIIKSGAKIGINVTILPGVSIGRNSMIGAGAVVTKDIPDNKIAYGNPARIVGSIKDIDKKRTKG